MSLREFDDWLIFVTGLWFWFKCGLFATIWVVSYKLMKGLQRTRLSRAQHGLVAGLAITSGALGTSFVLRFINGGGQNIPIEPLWLRLVIRAVLIAGLVIVSVYGIKVLRALRARLVGEDGFETVNARDTRQDNRADRQDRREVRQDDREGRIDVREGVADVRATEQDARSIRQDRREFGGDR